MGDKTVRTNRKGKVSFTLTLQAALSAGEAVTATATRNSTGDTSEFSPVVEVTITPRTRESVNERG